MRYGVITTLENFSVFMPKFYQECLDAWSLMVKQDTVSYEDVVNQIISNNQYISIANKFLFNKHMFAKGILTVGDHTGACIVVRLRS